MRSSQLKLCPQVPAAFVSVLACIATLNSFGAAHMIERLTARRGVGIFLPSQPLSVGFVRVEVLRNASLVIHAWPRVINCCAPTSLPCGNFKHVHTRPVVNLLLRHFT
jgi:hypothetical protein